MTNDSKQKPINGLDVISEIDRFQSSMRVEMADLPPSPAKEMMECAFTALVPLLAGLSRDYPIMLTAFRKQREAIESKIDQAKRNVAKAKENMDKLPSVEQIQKNITPTAPALPPGLSIQFADEMKSRYLANRVVDNKVDGEAAAWQDWQIAR